LIDKVSIAKGKFYDWTARFGKANEHNGLIPRDFWLSDEEKVTVLNFHNQNPLEGYKRLTYMMLDRGVIAVSPTTIYGILKRAGVLDRKKSKPSKKGTGFVQPLKPHEHWHCDVSYINIGGTFYYLCSLLDGYSRKIIHWEIKEQMKEKDIEIIIQKGLELYSGVTPRIISDRGPQFIAREFKTYIRQMGMTHVLTSPYYPQSNGKIERWHRELKSNCIRPKCAKTIEEARSNVSEYVDHYNNVRLHGALGYITPSDKLAGEAEKIFAEREKKLAEARQNRKELRQKERAAAITAMQ
jgi:transposase InsO family protein